MNFIGDIHGNYRTLLALLRQMPDEEPISVGDMIDRGPRSYEVLDFFRMHGKALLGNHEHMMINHFNSSGNYSTGHWLLNGGHATLKSLKLDSQGILPENLWQYIKKLPLLLRREGLLVTHAPIHQCYNIEDIAMPDHLNISSKERSVIWNREDPIQRDGYFQVFGHNGYRYLHIRFFGNCWGTKSDSAFAACIDTVLGRVLSGLNWPSMNVFEQEYID